MLDAHVEDRKSVFVFDTKTDKKHILANVSEAEMNNLKLIRDYMSLRPRDFLEETFSGIINKVAVLYSQPVGKITFEKSDNETSLNQRLQQAI